MEPISLAVVGTAVLTEGIKFLYAQAGEAIKSWRARKEGEAAPVPVAAGAPLEGELEPAVLDAAAMERLEDEIRALRASLAPYVDDVAPEPVDDGNQDLIGVVDGLRRSLEAVLGQRIRFRGEPGEPSGPLVTGEVDVDNVAGYVAGVRARSIQGGQIRASVRAKKVEAGGQAVAVDLDTIGGSPADR